MQAGVAGGFYFYLSCLKYLFIYGCAGSLLLLSWALFSFRERGLPSSCGGFVAVASLVEGPKPGSRCTGAIGCGSRL